MCHLIDRANIGILTMTIYLSAPSLISGFQFLVDKKPNTAVVSDIFAADLNGDGVQEAIFVGRQTQPATIPTWSNSTVHIFQANSSGELRTRCSKSVIKRRIVLDYLKLELF